MLLCALVVAHAGLISFDNEPLPPRHVVERFFESWDGFVLSRIASVPDHQTIELVVFDASRRAEVFPGQNRHRPVCCEPGANSTCQRGSLDIVIGGPHERVVFSGSSALTDEKVKCDGGVVYAVVIANCGDEEVTVNGSVIVESGHGMMDRRLIKCLCFTGTWFILLFVLMAAFMCKTLLGRARSSWNHRLFLGALILSLAWMFFTTAVFGLWYQVGKPGTGLVGTAVVLRALAATLVFYVTFVTLQDGHAESVWKVFGLFCVLCVESSAIEMVGILQLSTKSTGNWLLGFGVIPMDFVLFSMMTAVVLVQATRLLSGEAVDGDRRQRYLVMLFGAFVFYFVSTFATSLFRLNTPIWQSVLSEWMAFAIQPTFLGFVIVIDLWFLWNWSPAGWQNIAANADDSGDLGVVDLAIESDGPIPAVEIKRKAGKKRRKSDDGFDIDDFSDPGMMGSGKLD